MTWDQVLRSIELRAEREALRLPSGTFVSFRPGGLQSAAGVPTPTRDTGSHEKTAQR